MDPRDGGFVLPPGGGRSLTYPRGGRLEIKAGAADTGGAYALLELTIPPGGTGSPPHYHIATEEAFYVARGELTFTVGGRTTRAAQGSFVFVPRGVVHSFRNTGTDPAGLLITASPGDFEGYFLELAQLTGQGSDPPTAEALRGVAGKYGQVFVDPD